MQKKIIFLFLITFTLHTHDSKNIFLLENAGLSKKNQLLLYNILKTINKSSRYQQIKAAKKTAQYLQKIIDEKLIFYNTAHEEDKGPLGLAIEIISLQKEYLNDFARIEWHYLPYKEKLFGSIFDYYQWAKKRIDNQEVTLIDQLTKQLILYTQLEQNICLQTYWRSKHYFIFQKYNVIPNIINFWNYKPIQFSLCKQIKKFTSIPKIQSSAIKIGATAGREAGEAVAATTSKLALKQSEIASLASTSGRILDEAGRVIAQTVGRDVVSFAPDATGALRTIPPDIVTTLKAADDIASQAADDVLKLSTTKASTITQPATSTTQLADEAQTITALGKSISPELKTPSQNISQTITEATAAKVPPPTIESIPSITTTDDSVILAIEKTLQNNLEQHNQVLAKLVEQQSEILQNISKKSLSNKLLLQVNSSKEALKCELRSEIALYNKSIKGFPKDDPVVLLANQHIKDLKFTIKNIDQNLRAATSATSTAKYFGHFKLTADMMVQMGIMMGSQVAISWANAADAKLFAELRLKQAKIANDFRVKINLIQNYAQEQIQLNEQATSWGINIIQSKQSEVAKIFRDQQTHLLQSLIDTNIAENYLADPMLWDQYFLYAPMYTPNKSITINNNNKLGLSNITFPILQQSFTQGSWAVSPHVSTKNLTDTLLWKVENKKLSIESLKIQETPATPPSITKNPVITQVFPNQTVQNTWYNIGRIGNWSYNSSDNSFNQYKIISSATPQMPTGDFTLAGLNTIFTDYVAPTILDTTGIRTYQIEAELQVNAGKAPWVAGIIFNKPRWISGATDTMNQYRFCGLYCASSTEPITFCAAESFFITSTASSADRLNPVTPLEQIMNQKTNTSWKNIGKSLIKNPLFPNKENSSENKISIGKSYIISIYTQPQKIFVSLEEKSTDNNRKIIFGPLLIENRNPILFNGHGIGFVSSGCASKFILKKPESLVFTESEIAAFNKLVSSGTQK